MPRRLALIGLFALLMTVAAAAAAPATGYRWAGHDKPFDFLFGNHIDTHQQTLLAGGHLQGFFYIRFTGEVTADGVPEATHANCNNVPDECSVGWILHGVPVQATYLGHEHGQHPSWCVDPADLPAARGYSHFHWLNESPHAHDLTVGESYPGYLLKLTARDTFFFKHHGGFLITPGIETESHANVFTDC